MEEKLVSVVIPTYRGQAKLLPAALTSVFNQTYPNLEVVVVGDRSDEVREAIGQFKHDTRLRFHLERGGRTSATNPSRPVTEGAETSLSRDEAFLQRQSKVLIDAYNQGVELSQGEYIAFCDSDDLFNEDHLKVLVETFEKHPGTGLAFDNVLYFTDNGPDGQSGSGVVFKRSEPLYIPKKRAQRLVGRIVPVSEVFADNLITSSGCMIPRWIFSEVGLMDEDAPHMNDFQLFWRIGARFPIRFVNYVGARKRAHAGNLTVLYTHLHYECGVRCLEILRERYPEVCQRIGQRAFNKKLGRKYYRLGKYYKRTGAQENAREMYKKAMFTRKLSFRYHWEFAKSSIAQKTYVSSAN